MSTDKLHKLIHSLNATEKRYFKQSIRGGKDTKSVQLFLAILKQEAYDEAILVKKLDYTKNLNGFAVAKNHLYKLILKVLRENSPVSNDYQKVLEHLKDIEILETRGLRKSALRSLKKLREIAETNQWGAFLLAGEKWKYRLTDVSKIPDLSSPDLGSYIDKELQYENMYRRLVQDNLVYGSNQRLSDEHCYKEIITAPLMQDIEQTPNLLCRWYFCLVKVELAKSENNKEERQIWAERLIGVKYKMGSHGYVEYDWRTTSHFEYLNALIINRNLDKFYEEYPKMLSFEIPQHRFDLLEHRKRDALILRLHAFIYEEYSTEVYEELMQRTEDYLVSKNGKEIYTNDVLLISTAIYLYYSAGDYEKVLEWNAFLNQNMNRDLHVDNHITNQVIVIFSHYKLKNFEHVRSLLPAMERQMEKHNRLIPVHVFLLRYMKKIQKVLTKKEKNTLLRDFKSDMKALTKSSSDVSFIKPKGLIIWAESQIANMTLFETKQLLFEKNSK